MGCTHNDCGRKVLAKGLCSGHYERQRKGQDMDVPIREKNSGRVCSVDGCENRHRENGYCTFHAARAKRGALLDAPRQEQLSKAEYPTCSVAGCDQPNYAAALCRGHYRRKTNGGSMTAPIRPTNQPVGTVRSGKDGYITEKAPDGRWRGQHCVVMERNLGRPLRDDESVHHRNGQRDDNRLENLELWSRYQPAGQRVVDKVAYAREILLRYGSEFPA